jgi:hypothetical protein
MHYLLPMADDIRWSGSLSYHIQIVVAEVTNHILKGTIMLCRKT